MYNKIYCVINDKKKYEDFNETVGIYPEAQIKIKVWSWTIGSIVRVFMNEIDIFCLFLGSYVGWKPLSMETCSAKIF